MIMGRKEIAGSWYNSGYHGHFRSKSRSDFMCEYRHLAKPEPPKLFVRRAREPVSKHTFSRHDNRHSFMNDALYFEEGMGRKRLANDTQQTKADLLTWIPQKKELDKAPPKNSVYKVDYRGIPFQPLRQQLVKRPKTAFDDDRLITSYRYAHGRDNPNKAMLNAMSNDGLDTMPCRRQKASLRATNETVASCMSWYVPPQPRDTVPMATQTVPITTCSTAAVPPVMTDVPPVPVSATAE